MDIDALVAIAHERLRLRRYLVGQERNQQRVIRGLRAMVEQTRRPSLKIPMPIELAGLKSRITRADNQQKVIARIGERYDGVLDKIDELTGAHLEHVGSLEHYEGDLRRRVESMIGDNAAPSEGDGQAGLTGRQSPGDGQGQMISSETRTEGE